MTTVNYLVTTNATDIPQMRIAMVDGTVPGWEPRQDGIDDLHYDHHRPGGGKVQIDEMKSAPMFERGCIVTTLCDADAICAAAWLQLTPEQRSANQRKLWVIAHDCDYLWCPDTELAEFAAKAVATLKLTGFSTAKKLNLPENRKEWTAEQKLLYSSECFRIGTEWILDSCKGGQPWPGEMGEADEYWVGLEFDCKLLIDCGRVSCVEKAGIVDLRGIGKYIDPRAQQKAVQTFLDGRHLSGIQLSVADHKNGGIQYTLGSIPSIASESLDYSGSGIWEFLTKKEAKRRGICILGDYRLIAENWGKSDFETKVGFSPWGGRAVVGGSGWNTPSMLLPHEVILFVNCKFANV